MRTPGRREKKRKKRRKKRKRRPRRRRWNGGSWVSVSDGHSAGGGGRSVGQEVGKEAKGVVGPQVYGPNHSSLAGETNKYTPRKRAFEPLGPRAKMDMPRSYQPHPLERER